MKPDRQRRQHALEIHHLPVIEDRNLGRLARCVAERHQMRMRGLAQIQAAGDNVAEHEALDAELIGAVLLGEKPGLLERRAAAGMRSRGECPVRCREIGERQARLAEREDAQQLQRLGGGVDGISRRSVEIAWRAPFRRRLSRVSLGETIYRTVNWAVNGKLAVKLRDTVNRKYGVRPHRAWRNDARPRAAERRDPFATHLSLLVDHAGAESNTCVGLARLGLRAAWISRLGSDAAGDRILDAIDREAVDMRWVERYPRTSDGSDAERPRRRREVLPQRVGASVMATGALLDRVPVAEARAVL